MMGAVLADVNVRLSRRTIAYTIDATLRLDASRQR